MSELSLLLSLIIVLLTLFVVLLERKFLAYSQRRMGPAIMGRNGALQIGLDLIKLMTKETFIIPKPTSALAPIFLALTYALQLTFAQNFIFGPQLMLFDNFDALILYYLIFILLGNIFFSLTGLISQSRYAIIGTVRGLVHTISLDIFVTVIFTILVFSAHSTNFHDFVIAQHLIWYLWIYFPLSSLFLLILLLESKRTPFDHAETESEVVAGYAVEYSGSMLLMFYLAEYLHLVISSVYFILFFIGGWTSIKVFSFVIIYNFNINDVYLYLYLY